MSHPKWKQFEILVARIQADLAGAGAVVTPNDKIMGKTGIYRQIDVSIRATKNKRLPRTRLACNPVRFPVGSIKFSCLQLRVRGNGSRFIDWGEDVVPVLAEPVPVAAIDPGFV